MTVRKLKGYRVMERINIIEKEDPSVNELLNKTAKELKRKYNKQRKIKYKLLNKKTPLQKFFSIVLDMICVLMVLIAFIVCFSSLNSTMQGFIPSFGGCTNMIVSSRSMEKSGYFVGDAIIVRYVDTKTLNVDDKIAFYHYPVSYTGFKVENSTDVSSVVSKRKYSLTFKELLGFRNEEMKQAQKNKSEIIFHHIRAIYEDENGTRWFKTYGSSNDSDDSWWIKDTMVVGVEDTTVFSKIFAGLLSFTTKPYALLIIILPVAVLLIALVVFFFKNIQIAKLELDCVEEKRKITDPICVKNKVGYQMSRKTKYKILAQATDENREEYIKLLWKDGHLPNSVKKYYLRKRLLLRPMKDKLKLNRECEKKFKRGVKPTTIAKYYLSEKKKIEQREEEIRTRLKNIKKHKNA